MDKKLEAKYQELEAQYDNHIAELELIRQQSADLEATLDKIMSYKNAIDKFAINVIAIIRGEKRFGFIMLWRLRGPIEDLIMDIKAIVSQNKKIEVPEDVRSDVVKMYATCGSN